jgi:uncharacterized membrane protein (UPF0127 family)
LTAATRAGASFAAVLTFALASAASAASCTPQKVAKKAKLGFPDGKTIRANVVDTPQSREIGMMCLTKLSRDYGMLFVFPEDAGLDFWMKNTLVSLDMVWIGADKTVTVIHDRMKKSAEDTPDLEIARASGRGQYVLELPAGAAARHHLKAGDKLKFEVAIPKL